MELPGFSPGWNEVKHMGKWNPTVDIECVKGWMCGWTIGAKYVMLTQI
jgi:hypothetical protein